MDFINFIDTGMAFAIPYLVAFLVQKNYPPVAKVLTAFALCGIAALARTYFEGKLDLNNWNASVLYMFGLGQLYYATYGKKFTENIEATLGNH